MANDIVNMAFGVILAGIALAAALAFGLGGQDVAKYGLVRAVRSAEASLSATPGEGLDEPPLAADLPGPDLPDAPLIV